MKIYTYVCTYMYIYTYTHTHVHITQNVLSIEAASRCQESFQFVSQICIVAEQCALCP